VKLRPYPLRRKPPDPPVSDLAATPNTLLVTAIGCGSSNVRHHKSNDAQPARSRPPPSRHHDEPKAAALAYWIVPPAVSLGLQLWGLGDPAYSRDETATLSAAQRPFAALVHMLHNVDVVHGTYYALIWLIVRLAGPGQFATRLPSALATAAAAAAAFGLGRRLVSLRAGLAAGLIFAVIPLVSYWGQTARPYALETALAAITSYLLVRAMQAAASGTNTYLWWIIGYAVSLTVLGYVQFLGLMLVAAHLVAVVATWARHRSAKKVRLLALCWLAAALAAFGAVSPVIDATRAQRGFGGNSPVTSEFMKSLLGLIGSQRMAEVAAVAILCAIAVGAVRGRLRADWPGELIALCVPWLILPPVILIFGSHGTTLYTRYLVFCSPAAAVLLGAGLAALDWIAGTAGLAIFAALAWSPMVQVRGPDGHGGSDIVSADKIIAREARPGDVLLYPSVNEPIEVACPYGMRQLRNIELGESASRSGTLGGLRAAGVLIERREAAARRIWVVEINAGGRLGNFGPVRRLDFRKLRTWEFDRTLLLTLYVRQ
jgi:mannosyltransferase